MSSLDSLVAALPAFGDTLDSEFWTRLGVNLGFQLILIRLCYVRERPNREFAFSFFLFGLAVFVIAGLLSRVEISLGFAFGLFAIFSMLRYRTEQISVKEMTYLFLVIAVALLSSVAPVGYLELILVNALICAGTYVAESELISAGRATQLVQYEKIENIKPANRDALLDDLRERSGLDVIDVRVESIDYLRDAAQLTVYYRT